MGADRRVSLLRRHASRHLSADESAYSTMTNRAEISFDCYQLCTDARGFLALADLHARLTEHANAEIGINFSKIQWIDAHLAAPLLTIISHSRLKGNKITTVGMRDNIRTILSKNGFFKERVADNYNTTIPATFFRLDQEVDFSAYTRNHLKREEMPRMSAALTSKIFEGFDEIFANCSLHSQSPVSVAVTGQYFPRNEKLSFAISDGGRGVDGSLAAAGFKFETPQAAIDWAMQADNTSKVGDIPGGLGLKLLRDFIELNGGSLLVASSAGLWWQAGSRVQKTALARPFPGTVVVVEIRTNDRNVYDLKSPDPLKIW